MRKLGKPTTPPINPELLDELLKGYQRPEDLTGPGGLLNRLVGALVSRAMAAELTAHLGFEKGEDAPEDQTNRRNGKRPKSVRTSRGIVQIDVPRDRHATFEPEIIPKSQRHFDGFDDKILAMYSRGMSVRDIQKTLQEIYDVDVSPDLISRVTDAVFDEVNTWQNRALEDTYVIVYLDAFVVKVRENGSIQNRAMYLAVGVKLDGTRDALGIWTSSKEGAAFWLEILSELRARGVKDILFVCADGLAGLPEAIDASFPGSVFQTCIVHVIRASTRLIATRDRKSVCDGLRSIYTAPNERAAIEALDVFEAAWKGTYPSIAKSWRERWREISPFLNYPLEIRKAIYTTNVIEGLNRQIRKVIKTKASFPTVDSALKLVYLAIQNASQTWGSPGHWTQTYRQLQIIFGPERVPDPTF